ncbi:hypothetical protein DFJ73DRAFT_942319 [Zopfochytrium polystomum]|nr:hypothetical protein DFJ73DRAFT_942319 [Zopfochytrium polystomum]
MAAFPDPPTAARRCHRHSLLFLAPPAAGGGSKLGGWGWCRRQTGRARSGSSGGGAHVDHRDDDDNGAGAVGTCVGDDLRLRGVLAPLDEGNAAAVASAHVGGIAVGGELGAAVAGGGGRVDVLNGRFAVGSGSAGGLSAWSVVNPAQFSSLPRRGGGPSKKIRPVANVARVPGDGNLIEETAKHRKRQRHSNASLVCVKGKKFDAFGASY